MGFTDIHTHIVPGVDDGAMNMEQSAKMLKKAYDEGIRNIIATPHFGTRNERFDHKVFMQNFLKLKKSVETVWPDMRLYAGNEIYYGPGAFSGLEDGVALSLAGSKYVLVEFPFVTTFDEMFHGVRKFLLEGYIPVIAHVERYAGYIGKIKGLEVLVAQGALVQMNCSTVTQQWERGFMGRKSWPIRALKAGLVHFLGSDCHDPEQRAPEMKKAAAYLEEIVGKEAAEEILITNPQMILWEGK